MKIDILTIFPEMFEGVFGDSILRRAQDDGHVTIEIHNLRDWTEDVHKAVDDRPFGGGAGMVMRVDIIDKAVTELCERFDGETKVVLMDTKGEFYSQRHAVQLSQVEHMIIIVPHYEGVDHRVHDHIVDEVFSIGPYVLTGGELPAMVLVDSVVRLIPGVISEDSLKEESYADGTVQREYPQYTRPADHKGWKVPDVLLSGHHGEIEKWRKDQSDKLSEKVS